MFGAEFAVVLFNRDTPLRYSSLPGIGGDRSEADLNHFILCVGLSVVLSVAGGLNITEWS